MTKLIITFTKVLIALITTMLLSSCNFVFDLGNGVKGNGNVVTINRDVTDDFKSIEASKGLKVVVSQSDLKSISITADDNLMRLIRTNVHDGVLQISSTENYNSRHTPVVRVTMPVIESLLASAGSHLQGSGIIMSEDLSVKSASGSSLDLAVEVERLSIQIGGGSSAEVNGKALQFETSATSGSSLKAGELQANYITARASGGSSMEIYPILSLSAKASSGSSINYVKVPKTVSKESSSGGSVSMR